MPGSNSEQAGASGDARSCAQAPTGPKDPADNCYEDNQEAESQAQGCAEADVCLAVEGPAQSVDQIDYRVEQRDRPPGRLRVLSEQLKLDAIRRIDTWDIMALGHECLPLSQGSRAAKLVGLAIDEVAFRMEMIVQVGMDRSKLL
jgi:hypothetical protein